MFDVTIQDVFERFLPEYADRYREGEIHLDYVRRTDFTDVDADVLVNNYDAVVSLTSSDNMMMRSFSRREKMS